VFELGFMYSKGKPVYDYTSDPRSYRERVAAAFGVGEVKGELRDRDMFSVEDFGWLDNLTIVAAIEEAGGAIAVVEPEGGSQNRSLAAFAAFETCLKLIEERELRQSDKRG
jgi:nucleoside 2-deoxyribosyltransferase